MERQFIAVRTVTKTKFGMPHVHQHEEHELYYLVQGNTTYYIGDKIYRVEKGDFVFIPRNVLHKTDYEEAQTNERFILQFPDSFFAGDLLEARELLCKNRIIRVEQEQLPNMEALMSKLEEENNQEDAYKLPMMKLYVSQLLVMLCRYADNRQPELSGTDQMMYRISRYISANYRQPLSLKDLSKEFGISESHLSRRFKEYTGIGLREYITYVRITNGEKLLLETNLPVTQIAELCGYTDSNYFSVVFKRVKGRSPCSYRMRSGTHAG